MHENHKICGNVYITMPLAKQVNLLLNVCMPSSFVLLLGAANVHTF